MSVFRADWVDVALYIIMRIESVYNKERVFFLVSGTNYQVLVLNRKVGVVFID